MALTMSPNNMAIAIGKEEFWGNFPRGERYMQNSGPAANNISISESRMYAIDIDDNMKSQAGLKMPFKQVIEGLSRGATVKAYFVQWTDEYKSEGQIVEVPFDKLRARDYNDVLGIYGTRDDYREIGGKLMWQWAAFAADGAGEETETNADATQFPSLYSATTANNVGGCIHIGSSTAVTGTSSAMAGIVGELKEISPVPMTFNNVCSNCITIGFSRSSDYIMGKATDVIKVIESILKNRNYVRNTSNNTKWKDGSTVTTPTTTFTYTYVKGTSRKVFHLWDQLYAAGVNAGVIEFFNKTLITMGLQQFSFSSDLNKFVLIFDASTSNLDLSYDISLYKDGNTTLPSNGWIQVTKGTITYATGKTATVGKIVKTGTGAGSADASNQCVNVPVAFLMEEVNTSTLGSTGAYVNKTSNADAGIFAATAAGAPVAGWSRLSGHMVLNLHNDVPASVGSAQEFNMKKLQSGIYREGMYTKTNNVQIFQSDPWMYEKMRLNTTIAYGDTLNQDRQLHIDTFERDINNAMLFGKKTFLQNQANGTFENYEINNPAGTYAGTMAGIFSYEDFPLTYVKYPFTITADMAMSSNNEAYGNALYKFLETMADALSFNMQPGMYKGSSLFVSRFVMQTLGISKRRIDTAQAQHGNILGSIVHKPANEFNMYIENFEYVSSRGHVLRFIYDPTLDTAQPFDAPQFLLGRSGKRAQINPRWCIIAINRNHIKAYQHAAFPTKIYGGLQPNNNVNIVAEGIQGSATLELRFPKDHLIVDISPN